MRALWTLVSKIMPCTLFVIAGILLSGCIANVWTGVTLAYDRHTMYKKISDFQLAANANRALYHDKYFKRGDCAIDVAVFNGDLLLVGYVPTLTLRKEAYARVARLQGIRRLYTQIDIKHPSINTVEDSWITATIRSHIFSDSTIDPRQFKVVTSGQIVYLMGDVIPAQAAHVIQYARTCFGVKRVVKLFQYYNLSDKPQ